MYESLTSYYCPTSALLNADMLCALHAYSAYHAQSFSSSMETFDDSNVILLSGDPSKCRCHCSMAKRSAFDDVCFEAESRAYLQIIKGEIGIAVHACSTGLRDDEYALIVSRAEMCFVVA